MNRLIFFSLITYALTSCNHQVEKQTGTSDSIKVMIIDSASAVGVTRNFLNWYDQHMIHLMQIGLVDQTAGKNYSVNMDSCNKLMNELYASGFVTSNYLDGMRKDFVRKKKSLKPVRKMKDLPMVLKQTRC